MTAHTSDVNVISWNVLATFMLASGGDDGALRVWDLRTFGADRAANEKSFVANFTYHRCLLDHIDSSGAFKSCQLHIALPWLASHNICCLSVSRLERPYEIAT
jgi:hypothetical protein